MSKSLRIDLDSLEKNTWILTLSSKLDLHPSIKRYPFPSTYFNLQPSKMQGSGINMHRSSAIILSKIPITQ